MLHISVFMAAALASVFWVLRWEEVQGAGPAVTDMPGRSLYPKGDPDGSSAKFPVHVYATSGTVDTKIPG